MIVLALLTPTGPFAADGRAVAAAVTHPSEAMSAPMSESMEIELDRTGWVATAYRTSLQGNVPANAIDGNAGTRWANEEAQLPTGDQWFQIDLGESKAFNKLTMDAGSDYPRGYEVQVSTDGAVWQNIFAGAGSSSTMTASFEEQNARYIRIVQTGTAATSWWSINEIKVFGAVSSEEAGVTGVSLDASEANLLERENKTLTAVVSPAHANKKNVAWTTSSPEVAVVDNEGRVVAVGEGEATITATTEDGGFTDSALITVLARSDVPTGTISKKKGIASSKYLPLDPVSTNNADKRPIAPDRLESLDVSWAYNWSTDYNFSNEAEADFDFVPMIWGPGAISDDKIHELKQGKLDGKYTHLLGFNEPELAEQSSTTVEDAIHWWPRLMETGLRLGSPSVAYPGDGSLDAYGIYWLRDFMQEAEARNYPVDFITLHFYQDFTHPDAVEQLENTLIDLYEEYQKPIWITEIGSIVFGKPRYEPTELAANEYMREVIPMLESLPFIERYSWFVDSCAHEAACRYTNLYDIDDQITRMGEIYTAADGTTAIPVSGVTLEPPAETVKVGSTVSFIHEIQPAGAANYNVVWSSSNEAVATVSPAGEVTGIAEGSSVITVTTEDGGFTATSEIIVTPSIEVPYREVPAVTGKLFYGDFVWGEWYFQWNEDKARDLSEGVVKSTGADSALSTGQVYTHGDVAMIGFDQEVTFDKIELKSAANGQMPYRIKGEYSAHPLPQPMNIPASPVLIHEWTDYSTAGDTITIELDEPITARSIWFQALTDGANSEPGAAIWSVSEVRLFQEIKDNVPTPSPVKDLTIDEANDV
ncbi:MAG: polymerase, partial [Paenibacillus sp.]|nr:polymerase [Paenibacillus sp.]